MNLKEELEDLLALKGKRKFDSQSNEDPMVDIALLKSRMKSRK